jgi:hypothetical protein
VVVSVLSEGLAQDPLFTILFTQQPFEEGTGKSTS